jgi:hypothetical protein
MLFDLRGRCGRRDRRFFTYRATVLTPLVLLTTVSCSTLPADIQQPLLGFADFGYAECDLFSGLVTEEQVLKVTPSQKVRREQSSTSAKPKVATVRAPDATSRSVPDDASKKKNTQKQRDVERERELFREFMDWRNRQTDRL